MKLKRTKKGFTIIELVIVIAVIGILAAVLIPTFVNLTNKANEAADNALVNNLNKALKMEEQEPGHEKAPTLEGAIKDLEKQGYLLENLASKSGKDLLWSQSENQFLLNTENKSGKDYWKIVDAVPEKADQKYSYYAGKNFNQTNVTVAYGFDAGRNDGIAKVTYEGNVNHTAQGVAIRTNGGNLKIKGENDNVKHYGIADIVEIEKIAPTSYHEFGTTGSLTIEVGHVEVEEGAYIAQATVNNSASLTTKTTGKVAYLAASETATIEGTTITTTQKQVNYVQVGETSKYTYQENDVVKTALFVKTVDELNAALNGTTNLTGVSKVVLANDLTIEHTTSSSNVIVKVDTTLDLNGYKITCNNQYNSTGSSNSFFFVQNCEFRIVDIKGNGMISYNNTYNCNVDLFIVGQTQMTKNTTLILDSGILEFNSSNSNAGTYCIDVMDNHASYTASFIMNGGSILCKDSSGGNNAEAIRLYDNGNVANANRNCYVEINNGYITGDIYFQMGLKSPVAHVGEDTLVINGGTIIAKRPIRSTQYTANTTACWGYAVITLNGGNIIATEGFGNGYLSYMNIIGTSYGDSSSNAWSNVSSWTAEKIFNITDNR